MTRVDLEVARAQLRGQRFLEGLLPSVLEDRELTELCTWCYERYGMPRAEGPFDWERAWLKHLPAAPARVLVGGSGYGREGRFLAGAGYEVHSYDPSEEGVVECRRDGPPEVGTHQRLVDAAAGDPWALLDGGVDPIWLGWGSMSHVLQPAERAAILDACMALTEGPVFLSARVRPPNFPTLERGRFHRAGVALGRTLGGAPPPPGLQYQPGLGVSATLSTDELEAAASRGGRAVEVVAHPGITAIAFLP